MGSWYIPSPPASSQKRKDELMKKYEMISIKLVIVGQWNVGKTCCYIRYTQNTFPVDYVPTMFDNYACQVDTSTHGPIMVNLWEVITTEEYDLLRPLSYPAADLFLVCFDIGDRESFIKVKSRWFPELQRHVPGVPIVLCGMKCDRRDTTAAGSSLVSSEEAYALAKELRALAYFELSSLTGIYVQETFAKCIALALEFGPQFCVKTAGLTAGVEEASHRQREIQESEGRFDKTLPWTHLPHDVAKLETLRRSHESLLDADLARLFRSEKHSDASVVCVDGSQIPVHKVVLASKSKVFENILKNDNTCKIEDFKHIRPVVMRQALELLYSGSKFEEMEQEILDTCQTLGLDPNRQQATGELDGLAAALRDPQQFLSDIVLAVGSQIFHSHKALLCARCEFFATMFQSQFAEAEKARIELDLLSDSIRSQKVAVQAFSDFLEFIYTDKLTCSNDSTQLLILLELSDRFACPSLCSYCCCLLSEFLQANWKQDLSLAVRMLLAAKRFNAHALVEYCSKRIGINLFEIRSLVDKKTWQQLDAESLEHIAELSGPNWYRDAISEYRKKNNIVIPSKQSKQGCILC